MTEPFETLLLTWGFFLVSTEIIKIVFGTDFRNVANPLPDTIDLGRLQHSGLPHARGRAVAADSRRDWRSSSSAPALGIKIRAMVQNREVASLLGLNVGRMYKLVFASGAFLAGLAGALIAPMFSIDPYIGNVFLVRSFFVVIVGGIGQLLAGTLVGSFVIGGSETIFALVLQSGLRADRGVRSGDRHPAFPARGPRGGR